MATSQVVQKQVPWYKKREKACEFQNDSCSHFDNMALQERKNDFNIMCDFDRSQSPTDFSENKKMNKPQIERRRRARINNSLSQLKMMVVDVLNKQTSPKTKLEKADVLEMAVKYIRNIQRQQVTAASATDSDVINKYKSGFYSCAQEVTSFLTKATVGCIDESTKLSLLDHLASCMQSTNPQEGASTSKVTKREGKIHQVSQLRQPKMLTSSPSHTTTRNLHILTGQENTPIRGHGLRQASPLSTIDVNCLSLTSPPAVCTPKLYSPTSYPAESTSPVLLSNQGGSWTRVSYPGGAASFNGNSSTLASIPVSQSPMHAYYAGTSPRQFVPQTSPQQAEVAPPPFYHNNDFGLGLHARQPEGGDVWRPW